jgi:hypothetical protein
MKMEQTESSETSVYKIQMPGNYPEENIQIPSISPRHKQSTNYDPLDVVLTVDPKALRNRLTKRDNKGP